MDYPGIIDQEDDPFKFVRLTVDNTLHLDRTKPKGSVIKVPPARAKYLVENKFAEFCVGPESEPEPVPDDPIEPKKKPK
jgi:hypothetical protein